MIMSSSAPLLAAKTRRPGMDAAAAFSSQIERVAALNCSK